MTRDEFRKAVFARDEHKCVVPGCGSPAVDAHHIIERALWQNPETLGGYFLENGASLCEEHHIHAEADYFPPAACREWAGIEERVLPEQLSPKIWYTKWGKALRKPTRYHCKYPSTLYLPWSDSVDPNAGEEQIIDPMQLVDKPLVVTIKMDGSNVVLRREFIAARNGDNAVHASFNMLKAMKGRLAAIPEHLSIFGEWLYAQHSIAYNDLDAYLQIFGVYDASRELWLGWDSICSWAEKLGVPTVPVLEKVQFSKLWELQRKLAEIAQRVIDLGHEGIVVRSAYPFHYPQFADNVAKHVRANHVQTDEHWTAKPIVKNQLKEK